MKRRLITNCSSNRKKVFYGNNVKKTSTEKLHGSAFLLAGRFENPSRPSLKTATGPAMTLRSAAFRALGVFRTLFAVPNDWYLNRGFIVENNYLAKVEKLKASF